MARIWRITFSPPLLVAEDADDVPGDEERAGEEDDQPAGDALKG
jgi:hypothetical protein